MLLLGLLSPLSCPSFGPLLPESLLPGDDEGGGIVTFLSALVPSTETSCLVVGSMIAILFLSLVRVEVWLGGPPECAGGP
jgi:hypothetical protein